MTLERTLPHCAENVITNKLDPDLDVGQQIKRLRSMVVFSIFEIIISFFFLKKVQKNSSNEIVLFEERINCVYKTRCQKMCKIVKF